MKRKSKFKLNLGCWFNTISLVDVITQKRLMQCSVEGNKGQMKDAIELHYRLCRMGLDTFLGLNIWIIRPLLLRFWQFLNIIPSLESPPNFLKKQYKTLVYPLKHCLTSCNEYYCTVFTFFSIVSSEMCCRLCKNEAVPMWFLRHANDIWSKHSVKTFRI